MFSLKKGDLNNEQKKAIFEPDSVLLIACPGSGKTRTLTYKIAYELSKINSNKQFVIAITYTNIAAEEIKERIEVLGVDTTQLWIGTIHAFCLQWILNPYYLHLDVLKYGFTVITSHDSEKLLTELSLPYKSKNITFWDCGFIATPKGMQLTCKNKNKEESLLKILNEYYRILNASKKIDFEQILQYSFDVLDKHPNISITLSKIFSIILIDEYQDTKEIQYEIITKILNAGRGKTRTFIVGDPNQSIYESLGGYPMSKLNLENSLGFELKELTLDKNYRSSSRIIHYFDHFKTYSNSITPSAKDKNYPSLITYNKSISLENLINEISRLILLNVNTYGINPNKICIAAPQWIHIGFITRKLLVQLPDYSFDGPGIAPFSRDIDNFWFKVSKVILTESSPDMYLRRLRWSNEILNDLNLAGVNIEGLTQKKLLKTCNSITINENDGLSYLKFFFSILFIKLNIIWDNIPALKNQYNSFFESSEQRINKLKSEGIEGAETIENFKKVFRQKEGITVSTIHGVKGEEYDTVIGFALLDDFIPHFNDPNGNLNSKKLLYVLASRARKNLHLISETMRSPHSFHAPNGKKPTPLLLSYSYPYD